MMALGKAEGLSDIVGAAEGKDVMAAKIIDIVGGIRFRRACLK